jgi:hypothetical protein
MSFIVWYTPSTLLQYREVYSVVLTQQGNYLAWKGHTLECYYYKNWKLKQEFCIDQTKGRHIHSTQDNRCSVKMLPVHPP